MAHEVAHRVVDKKGCAGVGNHAEERGREAAEEVGEARVRRDLVDDVGCCCCNGIAWMVGHWRWLLGVDFLDNGAQAAFMIGARLKGEAYSNDFQRVCEEYGHHASQTAAEEAPAGRFLGLVLDHARADLLVGEELDAGVGEDAQQRGRVALEEACDASVEVDVADGRGEPRP